MKITHLLACGLAALSLVSSAYALTSQSPRPGDESTTQVATAEQPQTDTPATAAAPATEAKVDLNTANARKIAKTQAVNIRQARAIVRYRKHNGPFKSIDDLAKVNKAGLNANFVKEHHDNLLKAFDLS